MGLAPLQAGVRFTLLDRPGHRCHIRPDPQVYAGLPKAMTAAPAMASRFSSRRISWSTRSISRMTASRSGATSSLPIKEIHTEDRTAAAPRALLNHVPVPPSDLRRHPGNLLKSKDGADVTFQVSGETFGAHKCVLAARSPVFRAQFFGAMKESTGDTATVMRVDDMEAEAFGALLSFLYTDTLPEFPAGERQSSSTSMNQHLLMAADKYHLERLILICEANLCERIETGTAATILALAEQHNCQVGRAPSS